MLILNSVYISDNVTTKLNDGFEHTQRYPFVWQDTPDYASALLFYIQNCNDHATIGKKMEEPAPLWIWGDIVEGVTTSNFWQHISQDLTWIKTPPQLWKLHSKCYTFESP